MSLTLRGNLHAIVMANPISRLRLLPMGKRNESQIPFLKLSSSRMRKYAKERAKVIWNPMIEIDSLNTVFAAFIGFFSTVIHFKVACTGLYNLLCRLDGPSVDRLVGS